MGAERLRDPPAPPGSDPRGLWDPLGPPPCVLAPCLPEQASRPRRETRRPVWALSTGLAEGPAPRGAGRCWDSGALGPQPRGSGLGLVQGPPRGADSQGLWAGCPWSRCSEASRARQPAQLSLRTTVVLRGQQDGGWGQLPGGGGALEGPVQGRCPWEALAEAHPALAREQPGGMGNEGRGAVRWGRQGRAGGWGAMVCSD